MRMLTTLAVSAIPLLSAPLPAQPRSEPAPHSTEGQSSSLAPSTAATASSDPTGSAVSPSQPAADTVAGHLALSLAAGVALPRGRFGSAQPQSDFLKAGFATAVEAAYGFSRTVALGAWVDAAWHATAKDCTSCSATSQAAGATVRYHLVQGTRFDPWLSAGLGWRTTRLTLRDSERRYAGPELLRLVLGGDWYATSLLGLGPTLELDCGAFTTHPSAAGATRLFWNVQSNLRLTLDLPGK